MYLIKGKLHISSFQCAKLIYRKYDVTIIKQTDEECIIKVDSIYYALHIKDMPTIHYLISKQYYNKLIRNKLFKIIYLILFENEDRPQNILQKESESKSTRTI